MNIPSSYARSHQPIHIPLICDTELIIPLSLKGITRYIPTRKPTVEESNTCQYIDLTLNTSDWNPHDIEVSMQVSSVESSCNPMLLNEKVSSHYKGTDTSFIKAVGTT